MGKNGLSGHRSGRSGSETGLGKGRVGRRHLMVKLERMRRRNPAELHYTPQIDQLQETPSSQAMSTRSNERRVFVGNLPHDILTKDLRKFFERFGKLEEIDLTFPEGRGRPPFAFLEFEDPRDADDAVNKRNGDRLNGFCIRVEHPHSSGRGRAVGRGETRNLGPSARRSQYRVLVSGLPLSGSWQDLKDHMREAGDVCFADTFKDGTGVVEFLRFEDMKYAVKKLDDTRFRSHEGESAYIRVKEDYGAGNSGVRDGRSRSETPRARGRRRSHSLRRRSRSRSRSRSYDRH